MLLVSVVGLAKDVTVKLTDQRGAAVAGVSVNFDNEYLTTDEKGEFVMKGLSSAGTYSFTFRKDYEDEKVRISWDGTSSAVTASIDGYYVTMYLNGLTVEEQEFYEGMYISIGSQEDYTSTGKSMRNGKLYFWWNYSTLYWKTYDEYFGTTSAFINLEETKTPILVNPKVGKYKVSIGKITGRDGNPITKGWIMGAPLEENPNLSFYRAPGTSSFQFITEGYFPYTQSYTVVDEDVTVDVDLSNTFATTIKLIDCDGTPVVNGKIEYARIDSWETLTDSTDASGECVIYGTGYQRITIDYNNPLYGLRSHEFSLYEDKTETISLENKQLFVVRLKNAKQFKDNYDDFINWNTTLYLYTSDNTDGYRFNTSYFSELEEGEDIVFGTLVDKVNYNDEPYTHASFKLYFKSTANNLFPIGKSLFPLSEGLSYEYDLGSFLTVNLMSPEGYQLYNNIKVDDCEVQVTSTWDDNTGTRIYPTKATYLMLPGEHTWITSLITNDGTQSYPYGKTQQFTLSENNTNVVYTFNENDYCGVKFLVKDENGAPLANANITIVQEGENYYYGENYTTDANGRCTAYLTEPGSYKYRIERESVDMAYVPLQGKVEVGEEMEEINVSYTGWRKFTLRIIGFGHLKESGVSFNGVSISHEGISTELNTQVESEEPFVLTGSIMLPQGSVSGNVQIWSGGYDLNEKFTVEIGSEDVEAIVDFNKYYTVSFTVNGENNLQNCYISIYKDTDKESDKYNPVRGNVLVAGKYYARVTHSLYNLNDTIRFEIVDKNLTFDVELNPADYHNLSINFVNAPLEILGWDGSIGNTYIGTYDGVEKKYKNGKYVLNINHLVIDEMVWYLCLSVKQEFEIDNEDKVVDVDLSKIKFFEIEFIKPDGKVLTLSEEEDIDIYVSNNEETIPGSIYYALPAGKYSLRIVIYGNGRQTYYGELVVTEDAGEKIVVRLSDKPTAIDEVEETDNLSASIHQGILLVTSDHAASVEVTLYDVNARAVWQAEVRPNESVSVGTLKKGIYMVRMNQDGAVKTQKHIVK